MAEQSKVFDFSKNLLGKMQSVNGKIIGKDMQPFKLRLAKDNKGAMVNDIVDKYLRKELSNEFLQEAKEDYGIVAADIVREIAKREIEKVLGA